MRGSLSRCTTLSRRRARRPDSRIRRYNFLPAEGPVPVSALVIGNTDTFSSGTPPYSGGGGYSYASAGIPHPARAFGKGYSYTSTGTPTPPAPLQGDPHTPSAPPTPPAPSLAGYPYTSAGIPHLARTFAGGYPYTSPATPAPPTPSARDTHTLLPATPTPPAPSLAGYPYTSAGIPHLARAFGAPPPPPPRGRGPCVAISGEQPYPALLQALPMLWTVGISPRGEIGRAHV